MGMLAMQLNPYPKSKVNHIESTSIHFKEKELEWI